MSRPLAGRRVVVTRAAHQADTFAAAFAAAGAEVALLPLIEIVPPTDPEAVRRAAGAISDFDWLVLTSANAVEHFLPTLSALAGPPRGAVAVVGEATARAVRRHDVAPTLVANTPRAEGLVEALATRIDGRRVLVPQASDARSTLVDGLRRAGADVTAVTVYDKRLPAAAAEAAARLFAGQPLGLVTFTSPRIARHFAGLFSADWIQRRTELHALSIGPVTSAELRRLGVEGVAEAPEPTADAMAEAAAASLALSPGS